MPADAWSDLPDPWREAFGLAWESLHAGSPPVGAVVVNSYGEVVARGGSRRAEREAPPNHLAGSRLAHAEVNALAQLNVDQHDDHELYVTPRAMPALLGCRMHREDPSSPIRRSRPGLEVRERPARVRSGAR
jgi:tRNA(adenine34) deaminase